MGSYPHIFTPGRIGHVTVRNRTVMPSMGTNMSDHGFVNDAIVNHYVERAKGGVGLIMVEVTCVDTPLGLNTLNMLVADDDKYIPGLTRLASAIHEHGAKCFLQLSHTGRGARRKNIHAFFVVKDTLTVRNRLIIQYLAHELCQRHWQGIRLRMAKTDGRTTLGITISDEHLLSFTGKVNAEIHAGCGFSRASLLID